MKGTGIRARYKIGALVAAMTMASVLAACGAQSATAPASSDDAASAPSSTEPIIDAAHWEDSFPNQYASYLEAGHATYAHNGATGKVNAHTDVMNPPVDYPAPFMTGCLSCHSSAYQSVLMEGLGDDLFTTDVETVKSMVEGGITCYSCHENTPGEMNPVNQWVLDAAEKGGIETSDENMVCGQCHSMGDFSKQFSDTDSSTWSLLQVGVDPDDVWDYLVAEGTETPIVPTAEVVFNNFLGSTHETAGATCVDCHMQTTTDEAGVTYTKHQWQSVGTNEELYENCSKCHSDTPADRKAAVEERQATFTASMTQAQGAIDTLTGKLAEVDAAGAGETDAAKQATTLLNKATFYLAYGSDQSMGFHSMGTGSATTTCHETAIQAAEEGLALLG